MLASVNPEMAGEPPSRRGLHLQLPGEGKIQSGFGATTTLTPGPGQLKIVAGLFLLLGVSRIPWNMQAWVAP